MIATLALFLQLASILPEVHSVTTEEGEVVVRSAGISTLYLGPLQSNRIRTQRYGKYLFPSAAQSASGRRTVGGAHRC